MDYLHLRGIELTEWTQEVFKDQSHLMLFLSHVGDPRNAYLIYFPLTFICQKAAGIKVLWVAAVVEWLNAILKWVLFGHRPYWWVNESHLYDSNLTTSPRVHQYRLTCETGPGSPSGHCMITAAVFASMILSYTQQSTKHRYSKSVILWLALFLIMAAIGVSRCFIATHFPHQVIAGIISGVLLACPFEWPSFSKITFRQHFLIFLFLLLSGPFTYQLIESLGADPLWTVHLALKWCSNPDWVHLDTTLFFSLTRGSSSILGLGCALWVLNRRQKEEIRLSPAKSLIALVLAITATKCIEFLKIPHEPHFLFYALVLVKFAFIPLIVMVIIPSLIQWSTDFGPCSNSPKPR